MRRILAPSVAAIVALMGVTAAADEIKSGPQVGDSAGAYNSTDYTGPNAGRSLCYR